MKILVYDPVAKSYKKSRKRHSSAEPFYIITKKDVRDIYENSIYPTVEDVEMLFDEDQDYMRYTDFHASISTYDILVNECFDGYQNSIILIPSCRGNDEIDETRMHEIQDDSNENAESRFDMDIGVKYFSSSSSNKSSRSRKSTRKTSPNKKSGGNTSAKRRHI